VNGALSVSRYTLVELSRRRILLVFAIIGAVGVVALGIGMKLLYEIALRPDLGRSTNDPAVVNRFLELQFVTYLVQALGVFAALIAFAIGMTAIYHDLESGAAVSIFSKPVTRLAFTAGKVVAAVAGLVVVVGLLAVETRIVMLLFGGGLENALTGEVLAVVGNVLVVMLLVIALSTWMNNIVAALVAFIYSNVVEGIIVFIHRFADAGAISSQTVRMIFDVLYWFVPHPLVSSMVGDLARAQVEMSRQPLTNQVTASIPAASAAGDIAWWVATVVVFCALLYYSVRRRQV
jgi:ABC-type transport system involved in multi-copper enzyme maturation permease subunit